MTFFVPLMKIVLVCAVLAPQAGPPAEKQSLYHWFDFLGYPSVSNGQFVRIDTWLGDPHSGQPYQSQYGFLLQTAGKRYEVLTPDLTRIWFPRWGIGTSSIANTDFEGWAKNDLDRLQNLQRSNTFEMSMGEAELGYTAKNAAIAWFCASRGFNSLADGFYDLVSHSESTDGHGHQVTFREAVTRQVALNEIWSATLDFDDPKIPWDRILERHQAFLRNFPASEYAPRAREAVQILTEMVQEQQPAQGSKKEWPESVKEHVAGLIYDLCNQNGRQQGQPGSCDVFADWDTSNPAGQLAKIGLPAVAALINALSDCRFTRSIEYWRNYVFSHTVLRVRDVALKVLERIACRTFYDSPYGKTEVEEIAIPGVRKRVQSWWAAVQREGERAVLVAEARTGSRDSPQAVDRLIAAYPPSAYGAFESALHHAHEDWIRGNLFNEALKLKGVETIRLLREQLRHGADLETRIMAAGDLLQRDPDDALHTMRAAWRQRSLNQKPDPSVINLAEFLTLTGNARAVDDVTTVLTHQSAALRCRVVQSFFSGINLTYLIMNGGDMVSLPGTKAITPEYSRAVERLLASELRDTVYVQMNIGAGDISFVNPRICDLAAYALGTCWPQKYPYNQKTTPSEREAVRQRFLDIWRNHRSRSTPS